MASRRRHTERDIEAYLALLDSIRDDGGLQLRLPLGDKSRKPEPKKRKFKGF